MPVRRLGASTVNWALAVSPGCRGGDRPHGNPSSNLVEKDRAALGVLLVLKARRDHDLANPESVEQVGECAVVILIGVTEENCVQPG